MKRQDDFPEPVKRKLAERVGFRCSLCGNGTFGANSDPLKSTNVGRACHITAAEEGGPRYDPSLTHQERTSIDNGVWMCATCGDIIDKDKGRFPVSELRRLRAVAELRSIEELNKKAEQERTGNTVISIGQTGGQTAHQINNYGPPGRAIKGREVPLTLVMNIRARPIEPISFMLAAQTSEAKEFILDLMLGMKQLGFPVIEVLNVGWSNSTESVQIGTTRPASDTDDPLQAFGAWLRSEGFGVVIHCGVPDNNIVIGPG